MGVDPQPQSLKHRLLDTVERHGNDYLRDGRQFMRRLGLAVVLAGFGLLCAGVAVLMLVANSLFHVLR